jgi:dCMP deaminase
LMLCTHKPCSMCARRIVNSGIKNIIYHSDYEDMESATDTIFSITGTSCIKFDDLLHNPDNIMKILSS